MFKRAKLKKIYIFIISIVSITILTLSPFVSSSATDNNDISAVFSNLDKLQNSFFDVGGRITSGSLSHSAFGFSTIYNNVNIDSPCAALFSYEAAEDVYATLQSSYHYTIEFDLDYRMANDSNNRIESGYNWQFVLFSNADDAPSFQGVGAYSISTPIPCTSKTVNGAAERLRFDFDFYPVQDYPGFDGSLEVDGWGLYLPGMYPTTFSRIKLSVYNLSIKSYSPEEWQTKKIEEGFDNVHAQVVQGLQEYDNSLPDHDYSKGEDLLGQYGSASEEVESFIDSDSVNNSLADGTDVIGGWIDGVKCASTFINDMYSSVVTYYGIIPIAVMFSAVGLLLGLVKN